MKKPNIVLVALLAFSFGASAIAAPHPLRPSEGAPVCLKREYSQAHLERNPRQKLTALYVKLAVYRAGDSKYDGAKLVGVTRDGTVWGNDQPTCTFKANGEVFCFVECDGGSFDLFPRSFGALLKVTHNYYFPLFRNGANPEDAKPEDIMSFDGKDRDNSDYLLQKVDVRECDRALSRIRIPALGC